MQNYKTRQLSIGAAGMRGVVGPGLTPAAAGDFAAAFATMAGEGARILVGIDPRGSAELLQCAVSASLAGGGCSVVDGGILTAGMMHYLIARFRYDGGILITGGHQAAGWNALIPLAADGSYFDPLRQRELFDLYHARRFHYATARLIPAPSRIDPAQIEAYWNFLKKSLDCDRIAAAGLTVVGDFCNGAGAQYAQRFASLLNLKLIAINDMPSAVVPRDPEPRPRSEAPIRSIIVPLGAAAGLVFNRDMSRMGVVSDSGEPLSEELTYPLAADYFLDRCEPGSAVVSNICSSRTLDEVVAKHRCRLLRSRVGQASVIDLMRSSGAVLAGEGSGSFTTSKLLGFDAFLMAGLLLESVAVREEPLSAQLGKLPRFHMVKQSIAADSPHAYRLLRQLRREFGGEVALSETDGLRFDWPDGFLSLRLSGTEAVLRLISESKNGDLAAERAWRARLVWERLMS